MDKNYCVSKSLICLDVSREMYDKSEKLKVAVDDFITEVIDRFIDKCNYEVSFSSCFNSNDKLSFTVAPQDYEVIGKKLKLEGLEQIENKIKKIVLQSLNNYSILSKKMIEDEEQVQEP